MVEFMKFLEMEEIVRGIIKKKVHSENLVNAST